MAGDGKPYYINLDLGSIETGLWCDTCLLPSVYRFQVNHLSSEGVRRIGEATRCRNCHDGHDDE